MTLANDGTPDERDSPPSEVRLSRPSITRFSLYLRHLEGLSRDGVTKVSSGLLGEALGITDAQVRKDLACLGSLGHPGVGYVTVELIEAIRRLLGVDRTWLTALVGVGNLGRALLGYRGFGQRGFRVVALFDADAAKIGTSIDGLRIHDVRDIPQVVPATGAELGLLALPSEAAQPAADALVGAGIRGLLNFAPVMLRVPAEVRLVSVDVTVQLEQLAFLVQAGADG